MLDNLWRKLLASARELDESQFAVVQPAYLLREAGATGSSSSSMFEFRTAFASALANDETLEEQWDAAWELRPVRKRAGSIFREKISVGRTRNSDVVIAHPKVSKFHGYFVVDDGTYSVCDAGSTNGTFIDEERLAVNEIVPLSDGCELRFGTQAFSFVLPSSLHRLLSSQEPRG